jgi:hypothetical protein
MPATAGPESRVWVVNQDFMFLRPSRSADCWFSARRTVAARLASRRLRAAVSRRARSSRSASERPSRDSTASAATTASSAARVSATVEHMYEGYMIRVAQAT